jgi:hypothetical protein
MVHHHQTAPSHLFFPSFIYDLFNFSLTVLSFPFLHWQDICSFHSYVISLPSHWHWFIFLWFICDISSFSLTVISIFFLHLWSLFLLIYLFPSFICDLPYFSLTVIYLQCCHLWFLFLLININISSFPSSVISLLSHLSLSLLHLWSILLLILIDSAISSFPSPVISLPSYWQCYPFPFLHMWSGISLLTSHDLLPVFSQNPSIFALKYSVFTTFLGFLFCYFLSVSTVSYLSSLWKEPAIPLIPHPSKYSLRSIFLPLEHSAETVVNS